MDYEPARLSITAVRPGGRFLTSKIRVFIDFQAGIFAEESSLALITNKGGKSPPDLPNGHELTRSYMSAGSTASASKILGGGARRAKGRIGRGLKPAT
jgi:hypothetical protein